METLKEAEEFDGFSTPAAFDRAVAMFLCSLTCSDRPEQTGKKKQKKTAGPRGRNTGFALLL